MGKRSRQAARARRKAAACDSARQALSAETLEGVPGYAALEPTPEQIEAFERDRVASEDPALLELGFVARLDRGFPLVVTANRSARAEHAASFAKQGVERRDSLYPAVGDWVAVSCPEGHEMAVIEKVLPRRTAFARWRGGNRGERQVLASNIDSVLIVAALSERELPCERIARSLVLAADCGVAATVVLTKADRKASPEDLERDVARVRSVAGAECGIVITSSLEGEGIEAVRSHIPTGTSAMILGESGAGKSTLLNALLGREAMRTGAVRERDDAGRHTTVTRVMLEVPGGGVVVDAPGLRSLPLVGHERGLARAFPEIVAAAKRCRFGDCTHEHEPGCAVRALVEAGEIGAVRLETFLALAREMRVSAQSLDPDVIGSRA